MEYEVGDTVVIHPAYGGPGGVLWSTARVVAKVAALRDGKPGFIAVTGDGARLWGTDDEIIRVMRRR